MTRKQWAAVNKRLCSSRALAGGLAAFAARAAHRTAATATPKEEEEEEQETNAEDGRCANRDILDVAEIRREFCI